MFKAQISPNHSKNKHRVKKFESSENSPQNFLIKKAFGPQKIWVKRKIGFKQFSQKVFNQKKVRKFVEYKKVLSLISFRSKKNV